PSLPRRVRRDEADAPREDDHRGLTGVLVVGQDGARGQGDDGLAQGLLVTTEDGLGGTSAPRLTCATQVLSRDGVETQLLHERVTSLPRRGEQPLAGENPAAAAGASELHAPERFSQGHRYLRPAAKDRHR